MMRRLAAWLEYDYGYMVGFLSSCPFLTDPLQCRAEHHSGGYEHTGYNRERRQLESKAGSAGRGGTAAAASSSGS